MKKPYKTVILKLSGEALHDSNSNSILDAKKLNDIGKLVQDLISLNVRVGIVTGAGNIFRGRIAHEAGIKVVDGDYMGMVGTVINCKAISSILDKLGIKNVLYSALAVEDVAIKFDEKDAINKLNDGYVLIFAGGLGRPGITTDSTAAKRAIQINADAILAGKNGVDGVYNKDPNKYNDAKFLKSLTYQEVLDMDLKVMDIGAIEILKQSEVETRVFSMEDINNFIKVVQGEELGTTITKE
ncbi:MAG: UMP kinase [Candidatus Onthovivens sp.]|nr:UMP kinase [Candidatus Onthovivens sp.]